MPQKRRSSAAEPAPDLDTLEGLVAFMEETVRDIEDALAGRLFYEYESRGKGTGKGSLRLWRRLPGWQPRKGTNHRPLCGAKTRAGTPCRMVVVAGRKRCRLHGGASTGPKTAEGRARIAESNRKRAQKRADMHMAHEGKS